MGHGKKNKKIGRKPSKLVNWLNPTKASISRRGFMKAAASGAAAAAALAIPDFPGLPKNWVGGAWADDGPERPNCRFGIIALTDCSSIIMAHELGLFRKHGIKSTVSKEASWAVIRDKLTLGENQGTHMLYGTPYASTMGLGGAPVKPMVIGLCLNRNGQAITLQNKFKGKVKSPSDMKPFVDEAKAKGSPLTFAMTYPPGTHAMWIRYWLAHGGVNPDKDVSLITIPPPQMVQNMKVGKMDGYCVGEPWNTRAIADGIGYTACTTQQLWKDHPEKVLVFMEEFANKNPKTVKAVLRAVVEAGKFIDKMDNRPQVAEIVSQPQYINCPPDSILKRMKGITDYGDGRKVEQDKLYMTFHDRNTTFPWKSHGQWWMTQFRRWGMVKGTPDYAGITDRVNRTDLYREAVKGMGLNLPAADMQSETFALDGKVYDPAKPEEYALSFPVHNVQG